MRGAAPVQEQETMKVPGELRILLMLIISSANSVVGQSGQSWRGQNRYENNWPELFLGTELENEDNRTPHRDSIDNRTLHRDSIVSNCNPGYKTGDPGAVWSPPPTHRQEGELYSEH